MRGFDLLWKTHFQLLASFEHGTYLTHQLVAMPLDSLCVTFMGKTGSSSKSSKCLGKSALWDDTGNPTECIQKSPAGQSALSELFPTPSGENAEQLLLAGPLPRPGDHRCGPCWVPVAGQVVAESEAPCGVSTLGCPLSPTVCVQAAGPRAREQPSGLSVYTLQPGRTPQSSAGGVPAPSPEVALLRLTVDRT